MSDKRTCGLCDETYDANDTENVKRHQHPEPQSGAIRRLWLESNLPYDEWVKTTAGQVWLEHQASVAAANAVQAERKRCRREEVEPLRLACWAIVNGSNMPRHEADSALAAVRAAQEKTP